MFFSSKFLKKNVNVNKTKAKGFESISSASSNKQPDKVGSPLEKYDDMVRNRIDESDFILLSEMQVNNLFSQERQYISMELDRYEDKLREIALDPLLIDCMESIAKSNTSYSFGPRLFVKQFMVPQLSYQHIMKGTNVPKSRAIHIYNQLIYMGAITPPDKTGHSNIIVNEANLLTYLSHIDITNVDYNADIIYGSSTVNSDITSIDGNMTGLEFEQFSKELLAYNGFENIEVTKSSGDFGADLIAYKDSIKYVIQCKKYSSNVGIDAIQEVVGSRHIYNAHVGVVLTNSHFTSAAQTLAKSTNVILWDREYLIRMLDKMPTKHPEKTDYDYFEEDICEESLLQYIFDLMN